MRSLLLLTPLLLAPMLPAFADALPITDSGILRVSTSNGAISFSPLCFNFAGGATCVGGDSGSMTVTGLSNLFSAPSTGTIKSVAGTGALSDFETVQGAGALASQTIHFDLTDIQVNATTTGNCSSNAAGTSCSQAGSPFTLTEDASSLTISFKADLVAYTGSKAAGSTEYTASFTTQAAGTLGGSCSSDAADITGFIACQNSGGTADLNWAVTETPVTTPEPMSVALLGSAVLIALTPRLRRSRRG